MTRKAFERDFLRRLAPVWLSCRALTWWGFRGRMMTKADLEFALLGMTDYAIGMQLLCEEVLNEQPEETQCLKQPW